MKTRRARRDERRALDAAGGARSSHNDDVPLSAKSSACKQNLPFDSHLLVNPVFPRGSPSDVDV